MKKPKETPKPRVAYSTRLRQMGIDVRNAHRLKKRFKTLEKDDVTGRLTVEKEDFPNPPYKFEQPGAFKKQK